MSKIECFECERGHLVEKKVPWATTGGKGQLLIIPDVPVLLCDKCGIGYLGHEANEQITAARIADGVVYRPLPKRVK